MAKPSAHTTLATLHNLLNTDLNSRFDEINDTYLNAGIGDDNVSDLDPDRIDGVAATLTGSTKEIQTRDSYYDCQLSVTGEIYLGRPYVFSGGETKIDVSDMNYIRFNNTSGTDVTRFGGVKGQLLLIELADTDTKLVQGGAYLSLRDQTDKAGVGYTGAGSPDECRFVIILCTLTGDATTFGAKWIEVHDSERR